jgi:hypothetical protein
MRRIVLRRFLLSALAGLALAGSQLVSAQSVRAASFNPSDYFTYTYSITLSRSYIQNGEVFYAGITGTATCIQDAPVQPSEAFIRGRIIAEHLATGVRVSLNSGYSYTVSPVPSIKGEVFTAAEDIPLYFPWDSPIGEYEITGELIEARFKAGLWFDATDSFPKTQEMGIGYYRIPAPPPPTTIPPTPPPAVPEPPVTEPVPEPRTPASPSTELPPQPGTTEPPVIPPGETDVPQKPAVPQGGVSLEGLTDSAGRLNSSLHISSSDGLCGLAVEPRTGIALVESEPPGWLMLVRQADAPAIAGDTLMIGSAYALLPVDITFEPGARLTIGYYPAMLPSGMDETRLLMARWDTESRQWIMLAGCQVDLAARTVSAVIERADIYAVLVPVSPPHFELSAFSITPAVAAPGELVTVQCRVANSGSVTGYYELILEMNGNLQEVRRLVLEGGASRVVSFGVVCDAAGEYSVGVNGQWGSFSVNGSRHSYSSALPAEPAQNSAAGVIYWVQMIYGLNLALLGLILWLSRKWLGRQYASLKKKVISVK